MARLPLLKLAGQVLLPRLPQFGHDFRILRHEPIVQFVESFNGRNHRHRNRNRVNFHAIRITTLIAALKRVLARDRLNS